MKKVSNTKVIGSKFVMTILATALVIVGTAGSASAKKLDALTHCKLDSLSWASKVTFEIVDGKYIYYNFDKKVATCKSDQCKVLKSTFCDSKKGSPGECISQLQQKVAGLVSPKGTCTVD